MKSTNPVVANALNSVKAKNAKFKVGDIVFEPTGGSLPTKIIRVFNLPQDEKKMASEFGGDWKEVRADYMRSKTWYNIERDGKGAFYTDLDLKKVTNASCMNVSTNADVNPESLANWKRIFPKLKEFNNLAGWLKGEGSKLMNVARNFDDKKFHSIGYDIQSVCEWSERKSAEILKQA